MTADTSFKTYPYFLYPQAEALLAATDEEEREQLVRRVASYIGDPDALRRLTGVSPEEFELFYPDQGSPDLSTDDAITSFLDRFGGRKALPDVNEEEPIPVTPAVDYTAMLDRLEEEADAPMPADGTSRAIDSFLETMGGASENEVMPAERISEVERRETPPAVGPKKTPAEVGQEVASMENVRVLVRRKDYGEALDMLLRLQLASEHPLPLLEDQMRFIRKLMRAQGTR